MHQLTVFKGPKKARYFFFLVAYTLYIMEQLLNTNEFLALIYFLIYNILFLTLAVDSV